MSYRIFLQYYGKDVSRLALMLYCILSPPYAVAAAGRTVLKGGENMMSRVTVVTAFTASVMVP
jgi:hypothetical protein